METFVKIWFAQISRYPKIWRGGGGGVLQPPSPNGTYPYGCYHLFFQLNNGVIIMDPITWIPKSSWRQMNIISQTTSNFFGFSICHVWSEEEDFVAQIFLRNFSESEWNIGLLVSTCFISELIRISQSSCLPGVWVRVVSDILII